MVLIKIQNHAEPLLLKKQDTFFNLETRVCGSFSKYEPHHCTLKTDMKPMIGSLFIFFFVVVFLLLFMK